MEYSNSSNSSNNSNGHKPHFAQLAQSAWPQNENNGSGMGKAKVETTPVFSYSLYEVLAGPPALPELLQAGCSVFKTERQRDMFLVSAITVLSGCFNGVTGLYDGKMVNANMYCFLIAPPASDKSVLNWAKELGMGIHSRLIAENEAESRRYKAEMTLYKSAVQASDNTFHSLPGEPTTKLLYIPANSSSAAIMRHIQQNGGGGIICETEADTLTNTFKQEWGNFDDLLRKAFHQEMFSYSRKTGNEFVEVHNPKIAVALSGTPAQVSKLLVSNENGLVSRFLFYYSDTPAAWRDVSPNGNVNLGSYFQELSEQVFEMHSIFNGTPIVFQLTDSQWKIHNDMFRSWLQDANEDMGSAIKRLGIIAFKIAMVLTILRNNEKLPESGILTCNDTDLRIALHLVKQSQRHADIVYSSLLVTGNRNVDEGKVQFLKALPDNEPFAKKAAIDIGEALGIAERTVSKYIGLLCASGQLQQVKYGTYCKM